MATCPRNSTQAAISGHAISEDATGGPRRVVRALIGAGPVLLLVTEDHQDSCRKQAIALRTGSMSAIAILRQQPSRHQLAAMWMATIARTTPAVNVIIATNSIARSA